MNIFILLHLIIITLSNVLVQFPFMVLGYHTTWGALSYPVIFVLSDLTTRIYGAEHARKIVLRAMLPALLISYFCASIFQSGHLHWHDAVGFNLLAFRIAIASFSAYVLGQWLDISVFSRFRNNQAWWLAPTISSVIGNIVDTMLFFFIAFYKVHIPALANHWLEIALVDATVKLCVTMLAMVPIYGALLKKFQASH